MFATYTIRRVKYTFYRYAKRPESCQGHGTLRGSERWLPTTVYHFMVPLCNYSDSLTHVNPLLCEVNGRSEEIANAGPSPRHRGLFASI
jgi:hypothetical protein